MPKENAVLPVSQGFSAPKAFEILVKYDIERNPRARVDSKQRHSQETPTLLGGQTITFWKSSLQGDARPVIGGNVR